MGAESHLTRSLLAAAQGRWDDVDWSRTKDEIKRYRDGSDAEPGSDNHPTLAYGIALIVAWRRPDLLHRLGLTLGDVVAWWHRELAVRLRKGLQLTEERSRIYVEWEAALICWLYRAFSAVPSLAVLHLRYVRATSSQVALCAFPARPRSYKPPIDAKMFKAPLFVPLAGARSWSTEKKNGKLHAHHLGQCGWEAFGAHMMGMVIPSEFNWHRGIIDAMDPGHMGMSGPDIATLREAVRMGDPSVLPDLMEMLDGVGTMWPCRLIRFDHGSACLGISRAINGNTDPIHHMAIHRDGTVYYLTPSDGDRGAEIEPGGVNEFDGGRGNVKYVAWAGGEDEPRKELVLSPERFGRVLWDVHLQRDGNHVVRRPLPQDPPGPGPNPPEPPDGSGDGSSWWVRHRLRAIAGAVFLASILWALNQRGCF